MKLKTGMQKRKKKKILKMKEEPIMELTYHRKGDYLFPNLTVEEEEVTIGKYGMLRRTYLKEYKKNLYQSLLFAADDRSCDVSVVFGGAVIAGTRARKQRTMSFNAFASVNFPEIALVRNDRIVRAGTSAPSDGGRCKAGAEGGRGEGGEAGMGGRDGGLRVYDRLNERVFVLKLTPEMDPAVFDLLKRDHDAIILETFGIGGIPDYGDYQRALFDWVDSGRTLVVTTQVPEEGCDLGVYEVGRAYAEHRGILKGGDMTTEALVAKTMWALGQTNDADEIRTLFYRVVNHDRTAEA